MPSAAPFTTVLVANRGEIAVRVLRTARALGCRTVAVCSDPDRDGPWVRQADAAVPLGGSTPAESYLHVEKLVAAARAAGADAVHPGYGFLSENEGFARRCADAGLVFIGPPPDAIRLMGDKAAAKRRMIEAGVPCVPGAMADAQSDEALVAAAAKVGFPLLVKAVGGGGGRGMRAVREASGLAAALASARSEARNAFGRGDLMLERLVEGARHVEIQVFADAHGNVIHLGERECSVQRRHQKIVEETPSPAVDADLRRRMGDAAVMAARAIGYVGAGTVEFLLAPSGEFFFLEMNTRLQVEHPVTELVTGLDLVEWQLRVASGEPLPLEQHEVRFAGHAIEARLYAEDPAAGFLPQSGTLLRWRPPTREGVRVDAGVVEGSAISPFYDPMIAKVVAHGADRGEARRRLIAALEETIALGVATNRQFLVGLLGSAEFERAAIVTDTLDAKPPSAFAEAEPPAWMWALGALVRSLPPGTPDPWRSAGEAEYGLVLRRRDGAARALRVRWNPERFAVIGGGEEVSLVLSAVEPGRLRCRAGELALDAEFALDGESAHVQSRGSSAHFEEVVARAAVESSADGKLVAPMAGRVLAVHAVVGAKVARGECVAVVEAMKMEHRVVAPFDGEVVEVRAGAGEQVAARKVLVVIEP